ncbi:MAG: hypothetical protein AAGA66_17950 [Bacteroidota bacterium]
MKKLVDNARYELGVDTRLNRMYITVKGYWFTGEGYLADLEKACRLMIKGFKSHIDFTSMQTPRAEVGEVHVEAQRLLMAYGLTKTAEVVGKDAIVKMALKKYSLESGMQREVFSSHSDAKYWLDHL